MFEQKSKGGTFVLYVQANCFKNRFSSRVYRSSTCESAKVALLLFAFLALFRWSSMDTLWTSGCATTTIPLCLRGCGQLRQVFGPTFFRAKSCTTIRSTTVQQQISLGTLAFVCWFAIDISFALVLSETWRLIRNTLRVPCWILNIKLQNIHSPSNYTLGFSCKNRIASQGT